MHDELSPEGGANTTREGGVAPVSKLDGGDSGDDVVTTTSAYAREVIADKPSLYLRFGEAPGVTAVKNELGAIDSIYPVGVTRGVTGALTGDSDTSIKFDGASVIELPIGQECEGTSECVVELWVKIDKIQDGYGWILDHEVFSPKRQGWLLQTQNADLTFERWNNDSGQGAVYAQEKMTLREWHHAVSVADPAGFRMYYDGTLRAHYDGILNAIPATKAKWTVGATACSDCGGRSWFEGYVDELAVYEHSMSDERIKKHFAVAKGN